MHSTNQTFGKRERKPALIARSTAIYFAKEAYNLMYYNGRMKQGFERIDLDTIRWIWTGTPGWTVTLKSNGALFWAADETTIMGREWV